MFSSFALPFSSWLRPSDQSWKTRDIPLPPVPVHPIETSTEKRARTLKHLLKANHTNHSILWNHLRFHNHTPHILGSAYMLGTPAEDLTKLYESEEHDSEPWQDSPGEISKEDWREFLGKKEYQRAFVDFFEDQLVAFGYDWKALVAHYMYDGKQPLINSVVSGLAHPLIHLGYGMELDSGTVAIEAMALTACCYDELHKYSDDPSYTRPSSFSSKSTLDLLQRLAQDSRLKGSNLAGGDDIMSVPSKHEDVLLDYWNAWDVDSNPMEQFAESQHAAAAVVAATPKAGTSFDFFLLHILTSSHAVRILLPLVPAEKQVSLVRQWWLFAVTGYIGQSTPAIDLDRVTKIDLAGRGWKDAEHLALKGKWAHDAHYVKGIRALKVAAETWGDDDQFYLKAATRFSREFGGWGGFGM